MVGALVVRRQDDRRASRRTTLELLQTFAGQSALTILNARLFRELEDQSAELEVVSRHKSEFLASMSHELRTPLNAVIGFSEVLLDRMFGELNERQEEYLRDILSSGCTCSSCSTRSSTSPRSRPGGWSWSRPSFRVRRGAGVRLVAGARAGRPARHRARLDVADDVGEVLADELRFKQVVLNLLSNAVKFTPDGGAVDGRPPRRWPTSCVVTVDRHRHRRPARGPGADLRVLPAGRPGRDAGGGHRARAHAVQADRRALRRPAVAGHRGRRGQHLRVLPARRAVRPAGTADRRRAAVGAARRRRPRVAGPDRGATSTGPGSTSCAPATAPRPSSWPGGCPRRGRPRHPAAQAWTGGRCWRSSSPARSTADIPVVVVSIVDEPAGAGPRAPRRTSPSRCGARAC